MLDFTYKQYITIITSFLNKNYNITTLEEYKNSPSSKTIILRHDVDRSPKKALHIAQIENELGIKASYYFRCNNGNFNFEYIEKIKKLGHEIGYHYETLSQSGGDYEKAIFLFETNLNSLNKYYPVKTICMHGSPMSKWNNCDLWNKYNYEDYGIISDPAYDINFDEIFYITDASHAWNDEKVSVRDKVKSKLNYKINSYTDIINLLNTETSPAKIMVNIHPHNWSNGRLDWLYIYYKQSFKNLFKRLLIKYKKSRRQ